MLHDILSRLTPTEVIVSVIFYFIIHGVIWFIRKAEDETVKVIRRERKLVIRQHTTANHGGHPTSCDHEDCLSLITTEMVTGV